VKRVLIYHSPSDVFVWDTSTVPQRESAYLELFRIHEALGLFADDMNGSEWQLHAMARRGNPVYAESLLLLRKGRSSETYFEEPTVLSGPLTLAPKGVSTVREAKVSEVIQMDRAALE
jgi:hypothetical protein